MSNRINNSLISLISSCINISNQEIIDFVASNFHPDQVFTDIELEHWAIDNNFVKKQDHE